jgi:hypothetical protein
MKKFCWRWVKEVENKKGAARALVNFSREVRNEPDHNSGKTKIYEWLDKNKAIGELYVCTRHLEAEFTPIG